MVAAETDSVRLRVLEYIYGMECCYENEQIRGVPGYMR